MKPTIETYKLMKDESSRMGEPVSNYIRALAYDFEVPDGDDDFKGNVGFLVKQALLEAASNWEAGLQRNLDTILRLATS